MAAQRRPLSSGRWHLQHGPIDIVLGADGDRDAVEAAHEAAWARFQGVLDELVAELPRLREPVGAHCALAGPIARRMWLACRAHATRFVTPMAAVAGAVAEELVAFYARDGVSRAWINNGGDIALHLAPGASLRIGLFADLSRLSPCTAAGGMHYAAMGGMHHAAESGGRHAAAGATRTGMGTRRTAAGATRTTDGQLHTDGNFTIDADMPVRGVATSGWRGRSFSLGIADSVTVLARTAAQADAAATIIANAVDVDDARIARRPARELRHDSDLGAIPVTVDVPPLPGELVERALAAGAECARALWAGGLIRGAVLVCQGRYAVVDDTSRALAALGGRSGVLPAGQAPRGADAPPAECLGDPSFEPSAEPPLVSTLVPPHLLSSSRMPAGAARGPAIA